MLDATVNSDITQRGANSFGIFADGLGYSPVLLHSTGSITSSGDASRGIFSRQWLIGFDPNAFIRVRSDGAITMTGRNATGALLDNYITPDESLQEIFGYPYFFGAANVTATFNADVKSTGAGGRAIEILGREVTLNLNGDTLGGTDSSQRAGAGVVIRASRAATINNAGTLSSANLAALNATSEGRAVTLNNSGTIIGSVWLNGATGATFNNSGQFWTSGLQMSAGGMLQNSGFVGVAGGAAGGMDVRAAANVVNSGTISLANGVAGDQLTIGGAIVNQRVVQAARTYSGTGGATLAIDAVLTGAGAADRLNLTGAVSGATNVAVTNLARGATTVTPTFIPVVTGAAGASANAFALQGGVIASGLTDWSLEQRGDTFGLASRVNSARAGDAARSGLRAMNIFNLITAPDVGGAGGPGGASGSAILNYAPAPQASGASSPFGAFDAKAGVEPARDATAIAHLGAIHQRAKADGDDTKASAFFGGLDVVWGSLKGPAPRVTAGIFGGYSSGTSDMAGGSRAVTKANSLGARVRYDVDGWFGRGCARWPWRHEVHGPRRARRRRGVVQRARRVHGPALRHGRKLLRPALPDDDVRESLEQHVQCGRSCDADRRIRMALWRRSARRPGRHACRGQRLVDGRVDVGRRVGQRFRWGDAIRDPRSRASLHRHDILLWRGRGGEGAERRGDDASWCLRAGGRGAQLHRLRRRQHAVRRVT